MSPLYTVLVADLVSVTVLVSALYFPRHRRRDLVLSYFSINVGVLAVAAALSDSAIGAGVGLGLFGVLAIIRLRSTELDQTEVVYYFSALALGLLGGLGQDNPPLTIALMVLILAVMYLTGHPRLLRNHRHQLMVLENAFTDEQLLIAHLEERLRARVHRVTIQKVDLVNDTTVVDVRFELGAPPESGPFLPEPEQSLRASAAIR